MKARVHQNVYGNWTGYIGRSRVVELGTTRGRADLWLGVAEAAMETIPPGTSTREVIAVVMCRWQRLNADVIESGLKMRKVD